MYALVDCNNFFVSCERAFRPDLLGKPVLVLSNNDGCVIARSNEVKALGVKMGVPYFQVKKLCEENNVSIFSSNYDLYGDISKRIMNSLKLFEGRVHIYSIDEAFIEFEDEFSGMNEYLVVLRSQILKTIGVPVSIGVARTKTLAKVANDIAKKSHPAGVYLMVSDEQVLSILKSYKVGDVWGIGKKLESRFNELGVVTALDLTQIDEKFIRSKMSVIVAKTRLELRGVSCIKLDLLSKKKSIRYSKSFGRRVSCWDELSQALSAYIIMAAMKMRRQHSRAWRLVVFYVAKDRYGARIQQKTSIKLPIAISDNSKLIGVAKYLLRKIYKPDYSYLKVGVVLGDLVDGKYNQSDLFYKSNISRSDGLMKAIDSVNCKYNAIAIDYASSGTRRRWKRKENYVSPKYTTKWDDLCIVKC